MTEAGKFLTLNLTIDGDGMIEAQYPTLTFPTNISIQSLKQTVRSQFKNLIPAQAEIKIIANGQELNDLLILENTGLMNNDIVKVIIIDENSQMGNIVTEIPQGMQQLLSFSPDALIANLVADSRTIEALLRNNPVLAQAVLNNDVATVGAWQNAQRMEWQQKIMRGRQRQAQLEANPFSSQAQGRIMEEIRLKAVKQNRELAFEHMPEAFGRVVMLYVPVKIEGTEVVAFVDSGAQSTIISRSLAEKTGIFRLLDRNFGGVAQGVGQARILGRIHMVSIQFGNLFLPCTFTVMDDRMEFLLGLDMLKRYKGVIDLGNNCLRMGGETGVAVSFLAEAQIPAIRAENRKAAGLSSPKASEDGGEEDIAKVIEIKQADVQTLLELGFTEEQAKFGLKSCQGDAELAAGFLFQQAWDQQAN